MVELGFGGENLDNHYYNHYGQLLIEILFYDMSKFKLEKSQSTGIAHGLN